MMWEDIKQKLYDLNLAELVQPWKNRKKIRSMPL